MRYSFPKDITTAEVRAAVQAHNERTGTKGFIEAHKGDHIVFNYVVAFADSFPHPSTANSPDLARQYAILRECRGLIMSADDNGGPLARRYHKFFNVNEKPETQLGDIDWSQEHVVLEKLDGSMITPFLTSNGFRWGTKMGATEVAAPVEKFVSENPQYVEFAENCWKNDVTPIFEWCSRQQKIVIDYPEDQLILTAIRDNSTGLYLSYETLNGAAGVYNIPVVRSLPGTVENIEKFMAEARDLEGAEGYIIRFADGHMLKVKGSWYTRIHKTKELLQFEKDVWALVLEDRLDDAKAFMDAADRERVQAFADALERRIVEKASILRFLVETGRITTGGEKKRFATELIPHHDPLARPLLFSIWDGKNAEKVVRDFLLKNVGSITNLNSIRTFISGGPDADVLSWENYRDRSVRLDD